MHLRNKNKKIWTICPRGVRGEFGGTDGEVKLIT